MNTGEEKFAQTQPITEANNAAGFNGEAGLSINDVDQLGEQVGLGMNAQVLNDQEGREELGLKAKLEERDNSRLDLG